MLLEWFFGDVPTISSSLGNNAFGGDLIEDVSSTSDPDGDSVLLNYDWDNKDNLSRPEYVI